MGIKKKKLTKLIFDTLIQAFTVTPPGSLAEMSVTESGEFVALMWLTKTVDLGLFPSPWNPTNFIGSRKAVENTCKKSAVNNYALWRVN